jgi:hypothetical protein
MIHIIFILFLIIVLCINILVFKEIFNTKLVDKKILVQYSTPIPSPSPTPIPSPTPPSIIPTPSPTPTPISSTTPTPIPSPTPTPPSPTPPSIPVQGTIIEDTNYYGNTQQQLDEFYVEYGGKNSFDNRHVKAIEGMLTAEDKIELGDLTSASEYVESVFTDLPRSDIRWWINSDGGTGGSNTGHPVGYCGLRMIEQIVDIEKERKLSGQKIKQGSINITCVVATCATVRRPRVKDLLPETVQVQLEPKILENNARLLFIATQLFRRWLKAITGIEVLLRVVVMEGCSNVDFTDNGSSIFSYPNSHEMINTVSSEIVNNTDIWWVVTPSGTVGEEKEVGRHFVTGGMSMYNGLPLFLSDDLWFVRKFNHMGNGRWTEAEVRTYHPQWFQHEFMHAVYRSWPEFELEKTSHQWYDRTTWPKDFQGRFESDYYTESINRRLLTAIPSLVDMFANNRIIDVNIDMIDTLVGRYKRNPVLNDWHDVTVSSRIGGLIWTNAAGVSWNLNIVGNKLETDPTQCPYGALVVNVQTKFNKIYALMFGQSIYVLVK